jgi:hypothetical protein
MDNQVTVCSSAALTEVVRQFFGFQVFMLAIAIGPIRIDESLFVLNATWVHL